MNCALWLNRHKIRDAAEIPQNLDIASLRGYFLAGSLVEWLREHNGADYAAELEKIPPNCPELNSRICEIFGGSAVDGLPVFGNPLNGKTAESAVYTNPGSFTSFGSFPDIWEVLAEFVGSRKGSGIHEWEWEWLFGFGGSFGSFSLTSGGYEFTLEKLLMRLKFGSFSSFGSFGSFGNFPWELLGSYSEPWGRQEFPILDEYDLILLQTLLNCPLDRYGYGIHVI